MRAFLLVVSGLLLGVACGGTFKKTQGYDGVPEACCSESNMKLTKFKGCRIGGRRCGKGEIYWMQGSVSCTPIDEANCNGGRCCHYKPRYEPGLGEVPKEDQVDQFGRPMYPDAKKEKDAKEAADAEAEPKPEPEPEPDAKEEPPPEPEPKAEETKAEETKAEETKAKETKAKD